eukprot:scaffold181321_cov73-Attheya_sp.AAC.1
MGIVDEVGDSGVLNMITFPILFTVALPKDSQTSPASHSEIKEEMINAHVAETLPSDKLEIKETSQKSQLWFLNPSGKPKQRIYGIKSVVTGRDSYRFPETGNGTQAGTSFSAYPGTPSGPHKLT